MLIHLIVAVLLLGAVPQSAGAQTPGDAARRIEAARQRADAAGVPVSLLESLVAEGRAKGISMDRIAVAVEHRAVALVRAREVMGGEVSGADLSVGADALRAGVGEPVLRALSESAAAGQRAVAIAALVHLVQAGEAPEQALERVRAALERGPEALRQLSAWAARDTGPP